MKKTRRLSWINHRCCNTHRSCLFLTFLVTSLKIACSDVNFSTERPTLVCIASLLLPR